LLLPSPAVAADPLPPGAVARFGTAGVKYGDHYAAVAVSPDGKLVAFLDASVSVQVCDLTTGARELRAHMVAGGPLTSVAFLPGNQVIVCGPPGSGFHCFGVTKDASPPSNIQQAGSVHALAVAPDGKTLAAVADEHTVRLCSIRQATELRRLQGHTAYLAAVAFSPDGKLIASRGT